MEENPTKRQLKVLIVDDSHLLRERLTDMLGRFQGVQVVGSAPDVERGLELARELAPDVLTVDVKMPGRSGLALVEEIMGWSSRPAVIVLTSYSEFRARAMVLGADFFLCKGSELSRLPQILEDLRESANTR